jgi:hypothetical protein
MPKAKYGIEVNALEKVFVAVGIADGPVRVFITVN